MDSGHSVLDSNSLRQQLMSDHPMHRIKALHALEVARAATPEQQAAARFASRGIPFYSAQDPHYRAWVDKAVGHWERVVGHA
jgi:hypothetical protein